MFRTSVAVALIIVASWADTTLAQSLPFRIGENIVPGASVVMPEVATVNGISIRNAVPTVVVFTMVEGCGFCAAVPEIASAWIQRYPNLQIVLVDTRNSREAVESWSRIHALDIVSDELDEWEDTFDTNRVPVVYLLDENGVVFDKAVGPDHLRWTTLDDQMERANRNEWEAVKRHAAAPPAVGKVSVSLPSAEVGAGWPVVILVGDVYCSSCRDLVASDLQTALNDLVASHEGLHAYLYEPDVESLGAAGFYGRREVYQEYLARFGEDAADEVIVRYATNGELLDEEMPPLVWPEGGWAEGVNVVRYQVGGPDDPAVVWGYNFKPGLLVFDGEGRYLGPTPFFAASFGYDVINVVNALMR